jgi:sugar/nucleoside kinase (ribokinase family)
MTTPTDVLCAGIVVADHVCNPISHVPAAGELVLTDRFLLTIGGCAANVAVDLTRMGIRASVAGRVGDDVFGRVVGDMLREQGVETSALQTSPGADTSQTMIVNVTGDDRRFIHSFGANALFTAADIPAERVARCRVLYLGGYLVLPAVQQDELANVFAAARTAGAKTVLDVVVPGPGDHRKQLERLLPHVDVFLPNGHEAGVITGESDPLRQAEAFRRLGAATVVITMGSDGCVLVQRNTITVRCVSDRVRGRFRRRRRLRRRLHLRPAERHGAGGLCARGEHPGGELRPRHRHHDGRVHPRGVRGVPEGEHAAHRADLTGPQSCRSR